MTIARTPSDFFGLLLRHRVPFVILGGHAVIFHGHTRTTEDVDVLWLRSPETEMRLLAALQEANACWISDERDPKTGIERLVPVSAGYIGVEHLMMLFTDYGFIDLFDYVPGFPNADVNQVFQESVVHGGLRYVSLEWLKRMKMAAGRPKDQSDLEHL